MCLCFYVNAAYVLYVYIYICLNSCNDISHAWLLDMIESCVCSVCHAMIESCEYLESCSCDMFDCCKSCLSDLLYRHKLCPYSMSQYKGHNHVICSHLYVDMLHAFHMPYHYYMLLSHAMQNLMGCALK